MPLTLLQLRNDFEAGVLGKQDFVKDAYRTHRQLFEYPAYLAGTNLQSIEILEQGVAVRFRDPAIRMWCTPGEERHTALTCLNFRDYERQELGMMLRLAAVCAGNGCRTFMDIGANVGFYSLALAKAMPAASIYAFEPIPSTFGELRRNLDLNELRRVEAFNLGLSDVLGELTFYFDPTVSGATSSAPLGAGFTTHEVKCAVETLDVFAARHGLNPDLIKCDVEGAELKVFLGARKTLERAKPVVFSEMPRKWSARFGYHPNDIIALFAQLGYRCFTIAGSILRQLDVVTDDTIDTHIPKAQAAGLVAG